MKNKFTVSEDSDASSASIEEQEEKIQQTSNMEKGFLPLEDQALTISFHPSENLVASATITGKVYIHSYSEDLSETEEKIGLRVSRKSCRSVDFSNCGKYLFVASKDKSIQVVDVAKGEHVHGIQKAHESALNVIKVLDGDLLATGDEDGVVKKRDSLGYEVCIGTLTNSADGCLSIFDVRKNKPVKISEHQESELLSVKILKNGRKAVVGTDDGVLSIFSWGDWGDCTDRFPGHPASIDCIVKIDENRICTGSSDGFIRMISIQPNKFERVVSDFGDGFPIEALAKSWNGEILGSCSHDSSLRLLRLDDEEPVPLKGAGDNSDEDEEEEVQELDKREKKRRRKTKVDFKNKSKKEFFAAID